MIISLLVALCFGPLLEPTLLDPLFAFCLTVATHKAPPASQASPHFGVQSEGLGSGKVRFKVRLDRLGHLMVECLRGAERVETGLRGLSMLVQNGLMLKPGSVHLDPLQRGIQLDGMRFESSEAGARQLEEALNSKYAPTLKVE